MIDCELSAANGEDFTWNIDTPFTLVGIGNQVIKVYWTPKVLQLFTKSHYDGGIIQEIALKQLEISRKLHQRN